jgi:hypothetical protein
VTATSASSLYSLRPAPWCFTSPTPPPCTQCTAVHCELRSLFTPSPKHNIQIQVTHFEEPGFHAWFFKVILNFSTLVWLAKRLVSKIQHEIWGFYGGNCDVVWHNPPEVHPCFGQAYCHHLKVSRVSQKSNKQRDLLAILLVWLAFQSQRATWLHKTMTKITKVAEATSLWNWTEIWNKDRSSERS